MTPNYIQKLASNKENSKVKKRISKCDKLSYVVNLMLSISGQMKY